MYMYVSFPGLSWQRTTDCVVLDNRICSGGQESEIKVSAKLIPSAGSEGETVSCVSLSSGGCWQSFVLFDLFAHHSSVCLPFYTAFFPVFVGVCVLT